MKITLKYIIRQPGMYFLYRIFDGLLFLSFLDALGMIRFLIRMR
jgi:hypothetical protein